MKLNDAFPNWWKGFDGSHLEYGGLFRIFGYNSTGGYVPPWADTVSAKQIDYLFHGSIAGDREISGMLKYIVERYPILEDISRVQGELIMWDSIGAIFGTKWSKLWNTLSLQYNPIENYEMTETGSDTRTGTKSGSVGVTSSKTTNGTDNAITGRSMTTDDDSISGINHNSNGSGSHSLSNENARHGFNSSTDAVPTDEQTGSGTQYQYATETGTDSVNRDISTTESGSENRTLSGSESGSSTTTTSETENGGTQHSLTRHGNIGVTTSQKMIQSERDLWMWNFFIDVVFPDVLSLTTLSVY